MAVQCPCFLVLNSFRWADLLSNPLLPFHLNSKLSFLVELTIQCHRVGIFFAAYCHMCAVLREKVPNVLRRCHTKIRTGTRGCACPSFGMTPTFQKKIVSLIFRKMWQLFDQWPIDAKKQWHFRSDLWWQRWHWKYEKWLFLKCHHTFYINGALAKKAFSTSDRYHGVLFFFFWV